jgi:hypothetical protein
MDIFVALEAWVEGLVNGLNFRESLPIHCIWSLQSNEQPSSSQWRDKAGRLFRNTTRLHEFGICS